MVVIDAGCSCSRGRGALRAALKNTRHGHCVGLDGPLDDECLQQACCDRVPVKPITKGLIMVDPRDGRTSAAAMYPDAGSVLELHAFRTDHHVGRAEGMQLTCGDQERVHGAHISPAADARLGASSLLTSYSVRGGRVCSLKRVDPNN